MKIKTILITAHCLAAAALFGRPQTQAPPATPDLDKLQVQLQADSKKSADWPNLSRYRDEDEKLQPGSHTVVFMGDSITDFWGRQHGEFFPGKPYLNRGISGQTTPQMLMSPRPPRIRTFRTR